MAAYQCLLERSANDQQTVPSDTWPQGKTTHSHREDTDTPPEEKKTSILGTNTDIKKLHNAIL